MHSQSVELSAASVYIPHVNRLIVQLEPYVANLANVEDFHKFSLNNETCSPYKKLQAIILK